MKRSSSNYFRKNIIYAGFTGALIGLISLSGCNQPTAGDQATEPVPGELGELGEPGEAIVIVEDTRSDEENGNWMAQYIIGGVWADTWFVNQYERPFSAYDMVYQPHLDIQAARIRPAGDWTVFEVQSVGPTASERVYISLELDTDLDNRPDFLILTRALEETTWNDLMITILVDPSRDAGGNRPRLAEPYEDNWNGFEESYDSEISQAYVRRSPDSEAAYQIAVSKELLKGNRFIWRVWLEGEIFHPGWVEYNDRISLAKAGSPYLYSPNYPLKALASLDNTCLNFFGGETKQPQPGFCDTLIELSSEETLPPDDQFVQTDGDNPIFIKFPESEPGDDGNTPHPTLIAFNPGNFFQPTPTPLPNLNEIPTMEFVVPPTPDIAVFEVVTPEIMIAVAETLVAETILETNIVNVIPATDMFDPYAGSTQPPTEMFDPYQGSSPTPPPRPVIHFPTNTPAPTDKPVIVLKTATPTDKPIIILKTATPTP